jgi:dolichol kinase
MDYGQRMTHSVGHRRRLWRWFAGLTAVILALQVAMLVPLIVTVAAITLLLTVWSWDRYRLRHPGSEGVDDRLPPSDDSN